MDEEPDGPQVTKSQTRLKWLSRTSSCPLPDISPYHLVASASLLQPLATTDLFPVPIILPIPEYHGNGFIQSIAN